MIKSAESLLPEHRMFKDFVNLCYEEKLVEIVMWTSGQFLQQNGSELANLLAQNLLQSGIIAAI